MAVALPPPLKVAMVGVPWRAAMAVALPPPRTCVISPPEEGVQVTMVLGYSWVPPSQYSKIVHLLTTCLTPPGWKEKYIICINPIYIYIYMYREREVYIYIYIEREREIERERDVRPPLKVAMVGDPWRAAMAVALPPTCLYHVLLVDCCYCLCCVVLCSRNVLCCRILFTASTTEGRHGRRPLIIIISCILLLYTINYYYYILSIIII